MFIRSINSLSEAAYIRFIFHPNDSAVQSEQELSYMSHTEQVH